MAEEHAAQIIPVYPATREMASWKIAKAIGTVLDTLDIADDPLPAEVRTRYGLQSQGPPGTASTARWSTPRSSRPGSG